MYAETQANVNVPAIVESEVSRILNKHGSMPRDAFRQLIGSLSTRFEQHAMDLEFAGKDEEECFPPTGEQVWHSVVEEKGWYHR